MSTSKSHMYTANVWCCNMLNIIDVYFKVTHVYSMCDVVMWWIYWCLLQSHTCIQQMCDVVVVDCNRCLQKSHVVYSKRVSL